MVNHGSWGLWHFQITSGSSLAVLTNMETAGSFRGVWTGGSLVPMFCPGKRTGGSLVSQYPADELATTPIIKYPPNSGQESGVRTLGYCCNFVCVSWLFAGVFLGYLFRLFNSRFSGCVIGPKSCVWIYANARWDCLTQLSIIKTSTQTAKMDTTNNDIYD
jgi:hypothetical protein